MPAGAPQGRRRDHPRLRRALRPLSRGRARDRQRRLGGAVATTCAATASRPARAASSIGSTTYLDDFAAAHRRRARARARGAPTVLLGHSHGGLITLRALRGDRPPDARRAIVVVAVPRAQARRCPARRSCSRASRAGSRRSSHSPTRCASRTSRTTWRSRPSAPPTSCASTSPRARWFTESRAAHRLRRRARRIGSSVPTTWLVGGDDPIADPAQSRRVARRVAGRATTTTSPGCSTRCSTRSSAPKVFAEVTKSARRNRLNGLPFAGLSLARSDRGPILVLSRRAAWCGP